MYNDDSENKGEIIKNTDIPKLVNNSKMNFR